MTMQDQPIRRLPSGAIDTAHYCDRGRTERAVAARSMLRRIPVGKTAAYVIFVVFAAAAIAELTRVAGAVALMR